MPAPSPHAPLAERLRPHTLADVVVAFAAGGIREAAAARPALIGRLRAGSGVAMIRGGEVNYQ